MKKSLTTFLLFAAFYQLILGTTQDCQLDANGVCLNTPTSANNGGEVPSQTPRQHQERVAKGSNAQGLPPQVDVKACEDRYQQCAQFHAQGECENNPGWMIVNCPFSCNACHLRDPKVRCDKKFLNISTEPIYRPGDMNAMFESITRDFSHLYPIHVLSTDPWVVRFDNFINDDEIQALLHEVEGNWERSTDTGQTNEFGETGRTLSKSRTSNNAWCRRGCENNPLISNVLGRIEAITRIPRDNYESFQVLRYEIGQFYRVHHDMGERQVHLTCGPRILTFYMYLSDVEEGGETSFPYLHLDVKPKKGSAILWPSTHNDNLLKQDPRTNHEAKPVIKGVKYGANSWIHLYDFSKANLWGCTGTFDYI